MACLWGKHSVALCSNTLRPGIDVEPPPLRNVSDKSPLSLQLVIEFPAIVHWHTIRPCSLVLIFNSPAAAGATTWRDKGVVTVAHRHHCRKKRVIRNWIYTGWIPELNNHVFQTSCGFGKRGGGVKTELLNKYFRTMEKIGSCSICNVNSIKIRLK